MDFREKVEAWHLLRGAPAGVVENSRSKDAPGKTREYQHRKNPPPVFDQRGILSFRGTVYYYLSTVIILLSVKFPAVSLYR